MTDEADDHVRRIADLVAEWADAHRAELDDLERRLAVLEHRLDELERDRDRDEASATADDGTDPEDLDDDADVDVDTDASEADEPDTTDATETPALADLADERDADGFLDHTDEAHLRAAYEAHENIKAASEEFDVTYHTVYNRVRDFGIHETRSASGGDDESDPDDEGVTDTSEAPTPDDLAAADADDGADGSGDVVDDDQDADEDEIEVSLPDGVTELDVEVAVDEHDRLGDVAEELGVTRGRARTITVALGCYADVRDVPARGGGA